MLGTPIWSDMWDPGPRLKNPSAIPDDRSGITNLYFLEKYPSEMDTSLKRTSLLCLLCCTSILYFFYPLKQTFLKNGPIVQYRSLPYHHLCYLSPRWTPL